jgi:hypothetical protein
MSHLGLAANRLMISSAAVEFSSRTVTVECKRVVTILSPQFRFAHLGIELKFGHLEADLKVSQTTRNKICELDVLLFKLSKEVEKLRLAEFANIPISGGRFAAKTAPQNAADDSPLNPTSPIRQESSSASAKKEGLPELKSVEEHSIDATEISRAELLNHYKAEGKKLGRKITDKMIAEAASPNWHDRTPVQRWKRNDPRSTTGDDAAIRRVLKLRPHLK